MKSFVKKLSIFLVVVSFGLNLLWSNEKSLQINPDIKIGTLENGMSYYVMKNSEPKNRIFFRLVVKAGSNLEEDDQKGVAHFVEHLAFNGTENFKKHEIIAFLESVGMKFGAGLNAYTSFEETVYMLEIPADNKEILQKALLILHDWACAVSFEDEEVEKEKGVILEEWRSRQQSLSGRQMEKVLPFFLKDSRFEHRMPIGDMDVIQNISKERVVDFYKKWYKPEIMSVIAIGDISTSVLESEIKNILGTVPASEEKLELPTYSVPFNQTKDICSFVDPEFQNTILNVYQRIEDYKPIKTETDYLNSIKMQLSAEIFNERMSEIAQKPTAPWFGAGFGIDSFSNFTKFNYAYVFPKDNLFEESFKLLKDEYIRFGRFGVNAEEANRKIKEYKVRVAEFEKSIPKLESNHFISLCLNMILTGEITMNPTEAVALENAMLDSLTLDEINEFIKGYYSSFGESILLRAPESRTDIPTNETIFNIWNDYENSEIKALEEEKIEGNLMEKPSSKAKIVSKKSLPKLKAKEYVLDNGVKIITKKSKLEKDKIYCYGVSKGGLSVVSDTDYPNADVAPIHQSLSGLSGFTAPQLKKLLDSKAINYSFGTSQNYEDFYVQTNNEDFETSLQLVNQIFTNPQFSDDAWEIIMQNYKDTASKRWLTPEDNLTRKVVELIFGKDDIRSLGVTTDYIALMNKEDSERLFKERYGNIADFTFVILGDFNEKNIVDLCSTYLGTIESDKENKEKTIYRQLNKNEGVTSEVVYSGIGDKGCVYLAFTGNLPTENDVNQTYQDQKIFDAMCEIVETRLREVIREEKSGTYGVSVNGDISGDSTSERSYLIQIGFECNPEREEELANATLEFLRDLQTNGIEKSYTDNICENRIRSAETDLQDNNWWLNRIVNSKVFEDEPENVVDLNKKGIVASWITPEIIQTSAQQYFDLENYVVVYLKPEKK